MIKYAAPFRLPRGFVIFAHNNPSLDYGTMALCNALLIKKNLNENCVALIADLGTIEHLENSFSADIMRRAFDRIIINEVSQEKSGTRRFQDTRYATFTDAYLNTDRANVYDMSPFDETLMIDADYLMLDNTMDSVWGHADDFLCNRKTIDLDHQANNFGFDNRFNEMSIPLYWATAVYFRRTDKSKLIFELMNFIKENYAYYKYLYNFNHSGYFRNDYALSIAIHISNNLMEYGSIGTLPVDHILFSMENDQIHEFKHGNAIITSEPVQGEFYVHSVSRNVHIMNKRALLRNTDEMIAYAIE